MRREPDIKLMEQSRAPSGAGKRSSGSGWTAVLLILGILILLAVFLTACAVLLPEAAGYRTMNMEDGSMEPSVGRNSLLVIESRIPEEIREGDVAVFEVNGQTRVRRVMMNHLVSEALTVKGDARKDTDPDNVNYGSLIGIVKYHVPFLGSLLFVFRTGIGRIYAAAFALCGLLMILLSGMIRKYRRKAGLMKKLKTDGYIDKIR